MRVPRSPLGRSLCLAAALILYLCAAPLHAQTADDAARRFVILAYEGRFDALPKTADAKTDAFEKQLRNAMRVRCFRVDRIDVRERTADAITLDVTLSKSEKQTPNQWMAPEVVPLRLKMNGALVAAVELPDEEFVDRLLAASDEERNRILREHPERLHRGLARIVYARALNIINYGKGTAAEVSKNLLATAALERELAMLTGDRAPEAWALNITSIHAWMQQNDPKKAVELGRENVAVAETTRDPDVLARAWYNLCRGVLLHPDPKVQPDRETCLRAALPYAERAEDHTVLIRTLTTLTWVDLTERDNVSARRYADQTLVVARETGDIAGEIDGESSLASIYLEQLDIERALFHHQRALRLAEQTGSRLVPALLIRSGVILVEQEKFEEARKYFARALPTDERGNVKWNSVVSKSVMGYALRWMARMEGVNDRFDEAECLLRQAADKHPDELLHKVAPHYLREKKYREALQTSLASLAAWIQGPALRIAALTSAARAYRGLGLIDQALETTLEAIELREETKDKIAGDEQQTVREGDQRAAEYELAAELAIDRGDPAAALAFLERGRGRVLTDTLEHDRPGAMAQADAANEEERVRHERELTQVNIELDRARAANDRKRAEALGARLAEARVAYESFVDGIRAKSERRLAPRRPQTVTKAPAGMTAIEYLVSAEKLHVFVVRGDRLVHHATKIDREAVVKRVKRFVDMLARNDLRVRDAARDVYDLLLAPVERELVNADALLVIPDEALWRVPFAALMDSRKRFVIERAAIVYAPSLTAHALMSAPKPAREPRPLALLAVGNPSLDLATAKNAASFYRDASLESLPDAEREVDAIKSLYEPRSLVLKRDEATEGRTKSAIDDAKIIHFATHALLDDTHPMYSRLALARGGSNADDGWLEGWEIARLDLDADMVILSACETARGEIGGGEGVVGMTWSFFLAGARSTVSTQWKIASRSAADLMIAFHRSLNDDKHDASLRKAQALREAQLAMLRDRRYEHPFYWAPFVLLGNPGE